MKSQKKLMEELQDKYNHFSNEIESNETKTFWYSTVAIFVSILTLFAAIHLAMNYAPCINVPFCN